MIPFVGPKTRTRFQPGLTRVVLAGGHHDPASEAVSAGVACRCGGSREAWYVVHRECNYSAFNGYHRTWSAYSAVRCNTCGGSWRTKAAYVRRLPDHPPKPAIQAGVKGSP
jgi:hypothetical protein